MQRKHPSDRTNPVRWVWSHARRHWWLMIIMVIGAIGNASLGAVVPVLTGDAFNAMLQPVPDTSVLIPLANAMHDGIDACHGESGRDDERDCEGRTRSDALSDALHDHLHDKLDSLD